MSKRRMDAPDTVDLALHWLTNLQSEGWHLVSIKHAIDYGTVTKHGPKMPYAATLTVHLAPQ